MARKKYNWIEIKQKYLESEVFEVRDFINGLYVDNPIPEGTIEGNTRGWRKDKAEYKKQIFEKAKQKAINNPEVQKQTEFLLKALSNFNHKIALLLGGNTLFTIEDLPKLKAGYEILRLAAGKSTSNIGGDKDNPIQTQIFIGGRPLNLD